MRIWQIHKELAQNSKRRKSIRQKDWGGVVGLGGGWLGGVVTPFLNDWDIEKHKGPLPYQVCSITDLLPGSVPISSTCYYLHFALYITLITRSIYHCGGNYGADLLGSCRESWGWDWWKMVGANKSDKRVCLYFPQESQLFILFISSVYKCTEVKNMLDSV